MKFKRQGFTLIELMIVVALIGILASIAIPKYTQLIAKSKESTSKGQLGTIRTALSIYYSDTEGTYPTDALQSLLPKFMPEIPEVKLPRTQYSTGHETPSSNVLTGQIPSGIDDMAGAQGWLYNNITGDGTWGRVVINCSHRDIRNDPWTSF